MFQTMLDETAGSGGRPSRGYERSFVRWVRLETTAPGDGERRIDVRDEAA